MHKQLRQIEIQRKRGWILYLLYKSRPKALEISTLISLLDSSNLPLTIHRMAEELDFLRSLGLLRVWRVGGKPELSAEEQENLLHRYSDSDGDMNDSVCARLTSRGVNFQEGQFEEQGVTRVS